MTRSGIKQGLAISAVSALSIVGLPAAAHAAAPSTDAYQMSLAASSTSVVTGQATKYTLTVKNQNGGVATGDVNINVSEAAAATDLANPLTVTGGAADAAAGADNDWDDIATVTLDSKGQATFDVSSTKAGTVTVAASANGAASSSALTVAAAASGNDAVTSLTSSASTVDNYIADLSLQTVKITPLAGGLAMKPGVTVNYTITGPAGTAPKSGVVTSAAPDAYSAPVAEVPLSGLSAGSWTLKAWVNKTTGTTTPGQDAGEQSVTVAVNAVANPTATADTSSSYALGTGGGFASTAATGALLPADGAAVNVPLSVRLVNGTKPVAGVSVGIDVSVAGGTVKRYPAVTDSNGIATVSVPVAAADATAGKTIAASLWVSKSTDAGLGTNKVAASTVLTFAARTNTLSVVDTAGVVQAAAGGKVTIPVQVKDQFGKAISGVAVTGAVTGRDAGATVTGGTTDASGNTTLSYTDTGVSGTSTVTATAGALSASTTVQYISSVAPALVNIASDLAKDSTGAVQPFIVADPTNTTTYKPVAAGTDPAPVTVSTDGKAPGQLVTAHVVNAVGESLINAPVTVSVDNGLVGEVANPKNLGASITVKTDGSGNVTVGAGAFKAGSQTVTITAGTAAPVKAATITYVHDAPYGVTVSPTLSLVQGEQGKVSAKVTDQYGNPVQGVDLVFSQTGTGAFAGGASTAFAFTATDGTASVTLDSLGKVGSGTVTVSANFTPITPATAKADAMVAAYTAPIDVKYTVSAKPVVTNPALEAAKAKLVKDKAVLASATAKLAKDQAKLAKDKKALKHAKGAKKKALKKAVKALKKAISADKKAVSAANSAITADNKAIAAASK